MIKAYEAVTREIDDVEKAVAEILGQLEPMGNAAEGTNAVGILSCYVEYIESGVVRALGERLPFDLVGTTTISSSTHGETGDTMLSLLVLVSDDVQFATALSDPLDQEDEAPFRACYGEALAKLGERPVFMMSFFPLLTGISSDYYIERMSDISGNVPNFGTLSVDHTSDYHSSMVIRNGEAYPKRLAILLFKGNISPSFFVGNITKESLFPEKGVVTGSHGHLLHSVNNIPAVDYFQSIGLKKNADGTIAGLSAFTLYVDYGDGTAPVVRAVFAVTPDGQAICGGSVPEGAVISMGPFDSADIVVDTSVRTLKAALAAREHRVMIIYSCIGRYFAQGLDQTAEIHQIVETVNVPGMSYLAAYAGGELCPAYTAEGTVNRNHNNSIIICAF